MKMMGFIALALLATQAMANNKVVYGIDNRMDVFETSDQFYLELADSTAAMISKSKIAEITTGENKGTYSISARTLGKARGLCEDERYVNQVAPANCSGFLVAPDLLVTAGHCMKSQRDCDNSYWVFNLAVGEEGDVTNVITKSDVYNCGEIIDQKYGDSKDDYALIRLGRSVDGRTPLKVRTEGKVSPDAPLVMIGHPSGLPTKIAPGINVRDNTSPIFFSTNADAFGGNSGSAVFNEDTGLVEGILVRGQTDYKYSYADRCTRVNVCPEGTCRGEDVTRITNIAPLMKLVR